MNTSTSTIPTRDHHFKRQNFQFKLVTNRCDGRNKAWYSCDEHTHTGNWSLARYLVRTCGHCTSVTHRRIVDLLLVREAYKWRWCLLHVRPAIIIFSLYKCCFLARTAAESRTNISTNSGKSYQTLAHMCTFIWKWIYAKQIAHRYIRGQLGGGGLGGQQLKSLGKLSDWHQLWFASEKGLNTCRPSIPQVASRGRG